MVKNKNKFSFPEMDWEEAHLLVRAGLVGLQGSRPVNSCLKHRQALSTMLLGLAEDLANA